MQRPLRRHETTFLCVSVDACRSPPTTVEGFLTNRLYGTTFYLDKDIL